MMKDLFIKNEKTLIQIGTYVGLAASLISIVLWIKSFGQAPISDELGLLSLDLIRAIPAILGLLYFIKHSKHSSWLVPLTFVIYTLTLLPFYFITFLLGEPGGMISLTLFATPICLIISIYLIFVYFRERKL